MLAVRRWIAGSAVHVSVAIRYARYAWNCNKGDGVVLSLVHVSRVEDKTAEDKEDKDKDIDKDSNQDMLWLQRVPSSECTHVVLANISVVMKACEALDLRVDPRDDDYYDGGLVSIVVYNISAL